MRRFKIMDAWISIGLITASFIVSLIRQDSTFLGCYFVVGAWQIISMLVHAINGWFTEKHHARRYYHYTITGIAIATGIGLLWSDFMWVVAIIMLFAAPIMAIYYTTICYTEVKVKMQRPLAQLK